MPEVPPLACDQQGSPLSGEIETARLERLADIDWKQRLVTDFLNDHRYDALLLQKPGNCSWFSSGVDFARGGGPEMTAALFITPQARVVVTNNVDSVQIFEEEVNGLGFQLKQRAWHEPHAALLEDLCRGRTVASDTGFGRTNDISVHLSGMRMPLTDLECRTARRLGRRVAHAVEATARSCRQGQSEAEIAAEVAHRLIRHLAVPVRIQVAGDGRAERFRHWTYGTDPVNRFCTISATARRNGLCLGVSRTFSFGEAPKNLRDAHHRTMLMQATGMYFSQGDWELFEVWKRVKRIYEKFGYANEWQNARQAEIIGYETTEIPVVPKSEFRLAPQMMVYWHPTVEAAAGGDSILVRENGFELLTPTHDWPSLRVNVKGKNVHCPEILERAADGSRDSREAAGIMFGGVNPFPDDAESETDLNSFIVE